MDKYYKKGDLVQGYSILKIIGEGRYGIAYLAVNDLNEKCVIKQLKKKMLKETREKLFYEKKILKTLNNPAFPHFLGTFKDRYREGYILEYIDGVVFEDLIVRDRCVFTKDEIYKIANQLLDLAEILHNNNIVHRDIRLPNVIVRKDMSLALIDFGLARFVNNKRYTIQDDFWYIGDFLIHLYYTIYKGTSDEDKPWYEELDLSTEEKIFLKSLMGIDSKFNNISEVRAQLEKINY